MRLVAKIKYNVVCEEQVLVLACIWSVWKIFFFKAKGRLSDLVNFWYEITLCKIKKSDINLLSNFAQRPICTVRQKGGSEFIQWGLVKDTNQLHPGLGVDRYRET